MADLSQLSDEQLLAGLTRSFDTNKLLAYQPYDWQREWHALGSFAKERLILAANGPGKSYCMFAEVAMHATGIYPPWWEGFKVSTGGFDIWVGSIDSDMQKKAPQPLLLGKNLQEELGTGWLPARTIKQIDKRQAAIKDVVERVTVRHESGRNVNIHFLTYEQGEKKWQSADPYIIAIDEEPDEHNVEQKGIFSEILTRLVRSNGHFMCARTPLYGMTTIIEHFLQSESPNVRHVTATWDDAPHMDEEARARALEGYPEHERETRSKGTVMMGEGGIFAAPEDSIITDPIPIPDHWARIKGIDFGLAHPAARASIAHDRDTDTIYVYDVWRGHINRTSEHIEAINADGEDWIPVAWPHDGEKRDPKSGEQLAQHYRKKCRLLGKSARYKNDTGGPQSQWKVVVDIQDREATGRFKVFRTCKPYLEERRSYHQKDGVIVARRDDALKAVFYAVMSIRFAQSKAAVRAHHAPQQMAPFRTAV